MYITQMNWDYNLPQSITYGDSYCCAPNDTECLSQIPVDYIRTQILKFNQTQNYPTTKLRKEPRSGVILTRTSSWVCLNTINQAAIAM